MARCTRIRHYVSFQGARHSVRVCFLFFGGFGSFFCLFKKMLKVCFLQEKVQRDLEWNPGSMLCEHITSTLSRDSFCWGVGGTLGMMRPTVFSVWVCPPPLVPSVGMLSESVQSLTFSVQLFLCLSLFPLSSASCSKCWHVE